MENLKRSRLLYKMKKFSHYNNHKYFKCQCGAKVKKKGDHMWVLKAHTAACLQGYQEVLNFKMTENEVEYESTNFKIVRKSKKGIKVICKRCSYTTDVIKDLLISPVHNCALFTQPVNHLHTAFSINNLSDIIDFSSTNIDFTMEINNKLFQANGNLVLAIKKQNDYDNNNSAQPCLPLSQKGIVNSTMEINNNLFEGHSKRNFNLVLATDKQTPDKNYYTNSTVINNDLVQEGQILNDNILGVSYKQTSDDKNKIFVAGGKDKNSTNFTALINNKLIELNNLYKYRLILPTSKQNVDNNTIFSTLLVSKNNAGNDSFTTQQHSNNNTNLNVNHNGTLTPADKQIVNNNINVSSPLTKPNEIIRPNNNPSTMLRLVSADQNAIAIKVSEYNNLMETLKYLVKNTFDHSKLLNAPSNIINTLTACNIKPKPVGRNCSTPLLNQPSTSTSLTPSTTPTELPSLATPHGSIDFSVFNYVEHKSINADTLHVTSRRKSSVLKHGDYLYHLNKTKNGVSYYVCYNRDCSCRLRQFGIEITLTHKHNHEPDLTIYYETLIKQAIQNYSKSHPYTPRKRVWARVMRYMVNKYPDILNNRVVMKAYASRQYLFVKSRGQKAPLERSHLVLEKDELKLNFAGQPFLQYQAPANEILIFGSPDFIKLATETKVLHFDGTCPITPRFYSQLYIVYTWYRDRTYIVFYCFLPKKTFPVYDTLFGLIKEIFLQTSGFDTNSLSQIFIDYDTEMAYAGLKNNFREDLIKGCYSHYTLCIHRAIRKHMLVYFNSDQYQELRKCLYRIMALPLINPIDCDGFYDHLADIYREYSHLPGATNFFDYLQENWLLVGAKFPFQMWNRWENRENPQTHTCEELYSAIKKRTHPYPACYEFINLLKEIDDELRFDFIAAKFDYKTVREKENIEVLEKAKGFAFMYDQGAMDFKEYLYKISLLFNQHLQFR